MMVGLFQMNHRYSEKYRTKPRIDIYQYKLFHEIQAKLKLIRRGSKNHRKRLTTPDAAVNTTWQRFAIGDVVVVSNRPPN